MSDQDESDQDQADANLLRHLKISPQLLEIVGDNPEALSRLHRIQRAMLSEKATRKCLTDPNVTPQQIASVIEALRKAEVLPERGAGASSGPGFYFQITLPLANKVIGIDTRPVIEGTSRPSGSDD